MGHILCPPNATLLNQCNSSPSFCKSQHAYRKAMPSFLLPKCPGEPLHTSDLLSNTALMASPNPSSLPAFSHCSLSMWTHAAASRVVGDLLWLNSMAYDFYLSIDCWHRHKNKTKLMCSSSANPTFCSNTCINILVHSSSQTQETSRVTSVL